MYTRSHEKVCSSPSVARDGFYLNCDMERLFKEEGTNVTHGTTEALTNKGRKLTIRQMPY